MTEFCVWSFHNFRRSICNAQMYHIDYKQKPCDKHLTDEELISTDGIKCPFYHEGMLIYIILLGYSSAKVLSFNLMMKWTNGQCRWLKIWQSQVCMLCYVLCYIYIAQEGSEKCLKYCYQHSFYGLCFSHQYIKSN